jgi:hypothetical protein
MLPGSLKGDYLAKPRTRGLDINMENISGMELINLAITPCRHTNVESSVCKPHCVCKENMAA